MMWKFYSDFNTEVLVLSIHPVPVPVTVLISLYSVTHTNINWHLHFIQLLQKTNSYHQIDDIFTAVVDCYYVAVFSDLEQIHIACI